MVVFVKSLSVTTPAGFVALPAVTSMLLIRKYDLVVVTGVVPFSTSVSEIGKYLESSPLIRIDAVSPALPAKFICVAAAGNVYAVAFSQTGINVVPIEGWYP
jgi:hypothetical protein